MTALYEITDQHLALEKLADTDENMDEAIANTMEAIKGEFSDKAISLISVFNNMDGNVIAIDNAINKLQGRKKSIENKQKSMKEYLKINMEATGINKIQCPLFTITLAKGRDVVQIDDEDKISTDYLNIKTSTSPMKKEILTALKSGNKVEGCSVVKSPSAIRIKI